MKLFTICILLFIVKLDVADHTCIGFIHSNNNGVKVYPNAAAEYHSIDFAFMYSYTPI